MIKSRPAFSHGNRCLMSESHTTGMRLCFEGREHGEWVYLMNEIAFLNAPLLCLYILTAVIERKLKGGAARAYNRVGEIHLLGRL